MALGELLPVRAVQQWQVRVAGRRNPQPIHHQQLLGRVGEVVVAPDHVGDPHVGVVDRDGEVVENRAIAASDHEVVLGLIGKAHLASDLVGNNGVALIRYPEAHCRLGIVGGLAAVAAIAALLLPRGDVITGRRVAIRRSRLEQPLERLAMAIGTLVLADRALVPVELEPAQGVEDLLDVPRGRALAVGVLDPQNELSPTPPREEPVVQCRPRSPDMQGARRRRGEADADLC